MRENLLVIPWDAKIPPGIPLFGWGLLLALWVAFGIWTVVRDSRRLGRWTLPPIDALVIWGGLVAVLITVVDWGPRVAPKGMPIRSYGMMMLVGIVCGIWLAIHRARKEGFPAETIWDLAVWLVIPGIIGARALHCFRYADKIYAGKHTLVEQFIATIAIWEGGLVLQGALVAGAAGYFAFCWYRRVPPLQLADIITPSLFIGIGFGRIGCLLFGCCYGDACSLPWGIQFPRESVTFDSLMKRGLVAPDAPMTPPLHPTQIYSSLDGFFLAGLLLWFHRYRERRGEVFALALIVSPISRFFIELLRDDESRSLILGIPLTPAQAISLAICAIGVALAIFLPRISPRLPLPTAPAQSA